MLVENTNLNDGSIFLDFGVKDASVHFESSRTGLHSGRVAITYWSLACARYLIILDLFSTGDGPIRI